MTVWMQFHGGYSYSGPGAPEQFGSLAEAVRTFRYRYSGGDRYYPTPDEGARGYVYYADPGDGVDVYPDRVIAIGPRGGLRVEAA